MVKRMLIDATHPEETRVVVLDGTRLEEFDVETSTKKQIKSNIYLAKVVRVEPSLQAAFVEYGGNRHGFLAFGEIHPDYYQIPVADRERLLAEVHRHHDEDDHDHDGPRPEAHAQDAVAPSEGDAPATLEHGEGDQAQTEVGAHDTSITSEAAATDDHSSEPSDNSSLPLAFAPPTTSQAVSSDTFEEAEHDEAGHEDHEHDHEDHAHEDHGHDEHGDHQQGHADQADVSSPEVVDPTASETVPAETSESGGFSAETPIASEGFIDNTSDATASPSGESFGAPDAAQNSRQEPPRPEKTSGIETVGGEDADGGSDDDQHRRRFVASRRYKIQEVIKRRQIMLVQVVKEERGTKGAALTTYLSLAGRYCVLMPNSPRGGGVSRKIMSSLDRRRLKGILSELNLPKNMAVILRTAGAERSRAEIKRDYEYLQRTWDNIREVTMQSRAPALIHEEASLIKRAIRDIYSRDIEEVFVEGEEGYKVAKDFMKMLTPSHAKKVQRYKDDIIPLFHRYQVESQMEAINTPVVQLRSGGSIVFDQTEALVAIDVNSGRATRERHIEETAFKTNMEAADEVARQLRLRDLAGLIVIDFIDMEDNRNNHAVERRLKEALKLDRARIQVGRISHFGLLELSRQRLRPSLIETNFRVCEHCAGMGLIRSKESAAIHTLRMIEEEGVRRRSSELTVSAHPEVALYLLNYKRDMLTSIESRYGIKIFVLGEAGLIPPNLRIDRVKAQRPLDAPPETQAIRPPEPIIAEVTPEAHIEEEAEAEEPETEAEPHEEGGNSRPQEHHHQRPHQHAEAGGEAGGEGHGRRRRRRRRRKHRDGEGRGNEFPRHDGGRQSPAPQEQQAFQPQQQSSDQEGPQEPSLDRPHVENAGDGQPGVPRDEHGRRRRRGRRGGRRRHKGHEHGGQEHGGHERGGNFGSPDQSQQDQPTPSAGEYAENPAESSAPTYAEPAVMAAISAEPAPRSVPESAAAESNGASSTGATRFLRSLWRRNEATTEPGPEKQRADEPAPPPPPVRPQSPPQAEEAPSGPPRRGWWQQPKAPDNE